MASACKRRTARMAARPICTIILVLRPTFAPSLIDGGAKVTYGAAMSAFEKRRDVPVVKNMLDVISSLKSPTLESGNCSLTAQYTLLLASFPFGQNRRRRLCEVIAVSCFLCLGSHLHSVAAWVEEIDGLAETVVGWANHVDASFHQAPLALKQRRLVLYFESEVLNPIGRVRVSLRQGSPRKLEKGEITAVSKLEEDVQVWAEFLGRWNPILGNSVSEFQPDGVGVEIYRLGSIETAVSDMVETLQHRFFLVLIAWNSCATTCTAHSSPSHRYSRAPSEPTESTT